MTGLPDARYVALLSLNQPVLKRMFCSFATVNSPFEAWMYCRYASRSPVKLKASRTSQPFSLSRFCDSSWQLLKASSNRSAVYFGRSRNFRNSRCLLQWYSIPSNSTTRLGWHQFPIVVNVSPGLSLPQKSRTVGWRVGLKWNLADTGSLQSGFE